MKEIIGDEKHTQEVVSAWAASSAGKRIEEMRARGECVTSPQFREKLTATPVVPVLVDVLPVPATEQIPEPTDPSMPDG